MTTASQKQILQQPASKLSLVEVPIETLMPRLAGRRPVAIIAAHTDECTDEEDRSRGRVLVRSAIDAGFAAVWLGGRWREGDRSWTQWFLAVIARRECELALREWAVRSRQDCGQEVMIFKSSRNITDVLFDSGRTERWPGFSLELIAKMYQRSRGRGTLILAQGFALVNANGALEVLATRSR